MPRASHDRATGIPKLDAAGAGLKARLETEHWWYRGRRRIVLEHIRQLRPPAGSRILDAGCGYGNMLNALAGFGSVEAVDLNPLAIEHVRAAGAGGAQVAPLNRLPFPTAYFDLVVCLDVLEHVEDDSRALEELFRVTRPGGRLIVSVPAYPRLWSGHDVAAGHQRRYTRRHLLVVASAGGWHAAGDTHFNTTLLPLVAGVRAFRRLRGGGRPRSDLLLTAPWMNRLLEPVLMAEAAWLRGRRRLPAGLSLLATFTRPPEPA